MIPVRPETAVGATCPAPFRPSGFASIFALVPVLTACGSASVETAEDVVRAAIERHGGDRFEEVSIRWDFRTFPFGLDRDHGRYRYHRVMLDEIEIDIHQVMENDGVWIEMNGAGQEVDMATAASIESQINSTVYLGFLPFRLDDEAVRLADLGTAELEGRPFRKVEVTFDQEGGGRGWENRFVFWFRDGEWTLDYFAYSEPTDPPATRFRRAVNPREIGGLRIQDYENYTVDDPSVPADFDIAEYDRLFEEGRVRLVSTVEFENVQVSDTPVFQDL